MGDAAPLGFLSFTVLFQIGAGAKPLDLTFVTWKYALFVYSEFSKLDKVISVPSWFQRTFGLSYLHLYTYGLQWSFVRN